MSKNKIDYKWVVLILVSIAYFLAQGVDLAGEKNPENSTNMIYMPAVDNLILMEK